MKGDTVSIGCCGGEWEDVARLCVVEGAPMMKSVLWIHSGCVRIRIIFVVLSVCGDMD